MQKLAASGDGGVEVRVPSGRRHHTEEYSITNASAALLTWGKSLISADVLIEGVRYSFHAIYHPRATRYSPNFYYVVIGPDRDTGRQEEFQVYPVGLKWTSAGRPWNPLLVKSVLRKWASDPEVGATIQKAAAKLPKPLKKP